MQRPPHVLGFMLFVALAIGRLAAEETPSFLAVPPPIPLPEAAPPSRAISSEAAAKLAALTPTFTPANPPAPIASAADSVEPSDDRPRNRIIRLPSYVVTEPKIKMPKQRDMLTPKGRLELALKRYPGLRFGNIGVFRNDGIALMMLAEDHRLERLREMADLLSILPASYQQDPKVKRSAQELMLRPPSERTTGARTTGGK